MNNWIFSRNDNYLLNLIINNKKKATSSLYIAYLKEKEELPKIGDKCCLINYNNDKCGYIINTNVRIVKFKEVTVEMAMLEGEGDLSLSYWVNEHKNFFTNELKQYNLMFNNDIDIVFEEFTYINF